MKKWNRNEEINKEEVIKIGKEIVIAEIEQISKLTDTITHSFVDFIEKMLLCRGKIILSGVGKSGLIARKISATLSSTGTPSIFIDPLDACHGDMGMIEKKDTLLLLSYSGNSTELYPIVVFAKKHRITLLVISNKEDSFLAKKAHKFMKLGILKEVCPLNLAPTTSTTAMLLLGDALAITLMKIKKIDSKDFALYHPAGTLGFKLTPVKQVMKKNNLPIVSPHVNFQTLILTMTKHRLGIAIIVEDKQIKGIITDGDLRRGWHKFHQLKTLSLKDYMTKTPKIISPDTTIESAEELFQKHKITTLLVGSNEDLQGVLQIYDIQR